MATVPLSQERTSGYYRVFLSLMITNIPDGLTLVPHKKLIS
jgi:hypothetical protein